MHHLQELVQRMRKYGWQGRPLAVEVLDGGQVKLRLDSAHFMNWTGTHRRAAAVMAGLRRIPVVFVNGGRPSRKALVYRTTTDRSRYEILRQRRDPLAALLRAEMKINSVADAAGVL